MKKSVTEIAITSTLIVVLIFAISNLFKRKKQTKPKRKKKERITAKAKDRRQQVSAVSTRERFENLENRAKALKWGRDPFVYRSKGLISETRSLKLEGIVWDKESPRAILNGTIVGINDEILGYTIFNIKRDSIILDDGTSHFELRLGEEKYKK